MAGLKNHTVSNKDGKKLKKKNSICSGSSDQGMKNLLRDSLLGLTENENER